MTKIAYTDHLSPEEFATQLEIVRRELVEAQQHRKQMVDLRQRDVKRIGDLEADLSRTTNDLLNARRRIADLEARNVQLARLAARPNAVGAPMPLVFHRRQPAAGEVLPPEQRASWAQGKTEHDGRSGVP